MLTATVRGQQLQLRTPLIVADSINYITARFAFDKDWDGRSITAFFVQKNTVITALVQNNEITAEQGINLTEGTWELKLTGVKGNSRITAGPARMTALPFGTIDGDIPDISLTQYEQLLGMIGSLEDLQTAAQDSIVDAINELVRTGGGTGGGGEGGVTSFQTDETLYFRNGILGVNTADKPEEDNTLPITSAAVATTVGNIDAILKTI